MSHVLDAPLRKTLHRRAALIAKIRAFFAARDVVEVDTPVMSVAASTDPHLQNFSVQAPDVAQTYYLQTSPEFFMKRLLAAGSGCIYQISKAFRAGESGRWHKQEFSLLEWYRIGFDHHQLMAEVGALLHALLGARCATWDKITYQAVFLNYLNIDPLICTKNDLLDCAKSKGADVSTIVDTDKDTCLNFLFSFYIEKQLQRPTFVYDYPASQAMLARVQPSDDSGGCAVAMRFELFWLGRELANGFYELTDAVEQRRRFEADLEKRRQLGLPIVPMDCALLAALEKGLPDSAGVALGIDRLMMLTD